MLLILAARSLDRYSKIIIPGVYLNSDFYLLLVKDGGEKEEESLLRWCISHKFFASTVCDVGASAVAGMESKEIIILWHI